MTNGASIAQVGGRPVSDPADLVVRDGRIHRGDPSIGDVSAVAMRDGGVIATGGDSEMAGLVGARLPNSPRWSPVTRFGRLQGADPLGGYRQALAALDVVGASAEQEARRAVRDPRIASTLYLDPCLEP